jgi:hypothetical protein
MRIFALMLLLLTTRFLAAQKVLYSPFIDDRYTFRFEVAGKAGNCYWIQKENKKGAISFDIYDTRMNIVNIVPPSVIADSIIKVYFVPGNKYFDQLILSGSSKNTILSVKRYTPDGRLFKEGKLSASFPFTEQGNSFLLVRSEDKEKILLIGFESIFSSSPRLHAIVFDQDWHQLFTTTYTHPFFTQPLIQDDFFSYPIEHFNNGPVKLANSGQWLMASPSRTSKDFLLFHFCDTTNGFSYKEIQLPPSSEMQDVALSVDNVKGEAFAGILSAWNYTTLKNVHVTHYSMEQEAFDFDSSFLFNTLLADEMRDSNLTKESFIAVPGKGFMLLKEYGRVYSSLFDGDPYNEQWSTALLLANSRNSDRRMHLSINRDGYTRHSSLGGIRSEYDRGDLSLFYFPACKTDSCWSGMINKEQITELNAPYLSYLAIPLKDKLFLLYNSFIRSDIQYGTTTILDHQGNLLQDAGPLFWKLRNTLDFQQSRQITGDEVAIPYERNQRKGFSIIQF